MKLVQIWTSFLFHSASERIPFADSLPSDRQVWLLRIARRAGVNAFGSELKELTDENSERYSHFWDAH
jgi:hypothetical protein